MKKVTSVNSVYSVNDVCRVCNVNLLYNTWIWNVQLIRRCPFQRAKYSRKVVICAGVFCQQGEHCLSVLCMKCGRELDKFEKVFEGLSVFQEKADQALKEQRETTERGTNVDRV